MRWIVGDVHGCAAELDALIAAIRLDPDRDELWSVGDLVNTGPDSAAAVRLWRDVGGRAVLGNHDVYALLVRSGRWPRKSRKDTLDDLYQAPDAEALLGALRRQPILAYLPAAGQGQDAWLVHGGVHPRWTDLAEVARRTSGPPFEGTEADDRLEGDEARFATSVRCCDPEGNRLKHVGTPELCPPGSLPWDDYYAGRTLVVHGHWARRGHYRRPTVLGLDSGCVYGNRLTAWCQEEDRIVQVPSRQERR